MKKHYETHVEDTDKLISVAGPILEYKSWYEQYRKLMEEQAQRKYGLYTPTSEGDDDFPNIPGMIARWSAKGLTNEDMSTSPVWKDLMGNGYDLQRECIKEHTTQDNWKPSMATASLWKVVDEEHAGTIDDPIVYIPPMEIFKDKYYIQNGIKYKCTRNSEQPLTHDLSALVGLYVETI